MSNQSTINPLQRIAENGHLNGPGSSNWNLTNIKWNRNNWRQLTNECLFTVLQIRCTRTTAEQYVHDVTKRSATEVNLLHSNHKHKSMILNERSESKRKFQKFTCRWRMALLSPLYIYTFISMFISGMCMCYSPVWMSSYITDVPSRWIRHLFNHGARFIRQVNNNIMIINGFYYSPPHWTGVYKKKRK